MVCLDASRRRGGGGISRRADGSSPVMAMEGIGVGVPGCERPSPRSRQFQAGQPAAGAVREGPRRVRHDCIHVSGVVGHDKQAGAGASVPHSDGTVPGAGQEQVPLGGGRER